LEILEPNQNIVIVIDSNFDVEATIRELVTMTMSW